MRIAAAAKWIAFAVGLLDFLLVPSLWLGSGASCSSELQFIEAQFFLYTFATSLSDVQVLNSVW